MRDEIKSFDNRLDASIQTRMRVEMRTLVERASRWLVNNRRPPLDSQGTVDYFRGPVAAADGRAAVGADRVASCGPTRAAAAGLVDQGVPDDLASRVAVLHPAYQLLGVVEIADRMSLDPLEVARLHFALGERLGLPDLVTRILALPRDDRWQTMARAALRDDVYAVHAQLTRPGAARHRSRRGVRWPSGSGLGGRRRGGRHTGPPPSSSEICSDDTADLARMSVGLRVVRGLLAN